MILTFINFNRMLAAVNQLADNIPVLTNPDIIVLDTYAIVIYSSVNPESFSGNTVAALVGRPFQFANFSRDDISVEGGGYGETATAEIRTPSSLFDRVTTITNPTRVIYNVFLNGALFTRRQSYLDNNNASTGSLSSVVVSARISGDVPVANLADQVWMAFLKNNTVRTKV